MRGTSTPLSVTIALMIAALAVATIVTKGLVKYPEIRTGSSQASAIATDTPTSEAHLPTVDGRTISLADYRGKKLVVIFWASWCGACRLELPALRSFFYRTYGRGKQLQVLTINLDENREAVKAAAEQAKLPFPVVLDPKHKLARTFGVQVIPALFVIGKNGELEYHATGFDPALDTILAGQLGIDVEGVGRSTNRSNRFGF